MNCPHPIARELGNGNCPLCVSLVTAIDMEMFDLIDIDAIEREKTRRACISRFSNFVKAAWHVLEPGNELLWNWHLEVIADHIQQQLEDWARKKENPDYQQRAQNFLINVPPGTAKSRLVSVMAPAWAWLRWPEMRVLCLSTNPEVAIRDGDHTRNLVESEWYCETFQPEWGVRTDADAKSNFSTTAGGQRMSKGMGAKIVGIRFDWLVLDDPNDPSRAHSAVDRNSVIRTWEDTIWSRVSDMRYSIRTCIMQRAHEDDFSGHALRLGSWRHLKMPMIYEENSCKCEDCERGETVYGWRDPRGEGDALHPERFPPEVLAAEMANSLRWAGQYQQRPAPAEGAYFKRRWFQYYIDLPKFEQTVISLDAQFAKTGSSQTSFLVIGRHRQYRYVIEDITRKMSYVETKEYLAGLIERFQNAVILVEKKANGDAIINELKSSGIPNVIAINPEGGKESRAASILPMVEAGDVLLPKHAPWVADFIAELIAFPNGRYDDRVDALSQALAYMRGTVAAARLLTTWGRGR